MAAYASLARRPAGSLPLAAVDPPALPDVRLGGIVTHGAILAALPVGAVLPGQCFHYFRRHSNSPTGGRWALTASSAPAVASALPVGFRTSPLAN